MVKKLIDYIKDAEARKVAVGHFNISNLEILRGIFNAAKGLDLPVIIGTSKGEADFVGRRQAAALVKSLRDEYDYPIFLNADHCGSFEEVKEAVLAGYDSALFDGASLPILENIKEMKKCIEFAKSENPDILIEGELGNIGKSSKLLDEIPAGVKMSKEFFTKVSEAEEFARETGADMFAPFVGNIHGMLKGAPHDPELDAERVKEIKTAIPKIPLVLHGASGNSKEDIEKTISAGIAVVHINTEIRLAYRNAIRIALQENPEELAPYKYLKAGVLAVEKLATEKLKIFNGMA